MCGDESCKCGRPVITGLSVVSAGQSRSTGSDTWWHRVQNLYSVVVEMNTEPLSCCSEVLEGVFRVLDGLSVICDTHSSLDEILTSDTSLSYKVNVLQITNLGNITGTQHEKKTVNFQSGVS